MTIQVNGLSRETGADTVSALVAELALSPHVILIERNEDPLHRDQWPLTPLEEGDRLEILRVAAGG